jgi:ABC-2 type transport system ATP-binding protein
VITTSAPRPAIAVTGLQKSFGDKVVLDGIDLTVQEGTIFALLGPNGAGKTTAPATTSAARRTRSAPPSA